MTVRSLVGDSSGVIMVQWLKAARGCSFRSTDLTLERSAHVVLGWLCIERPFVNWELAGDEYHSKPGGQLLSTARQTFAISGRPRSLREYQCDSLSIQVQATTLATPLSPTTSWQT